jgi:serine/threonine protein kinase
MFAIEAFKKSIELIRKLHGLGIVHGDIHIRNINLADPSITVDNILGTENLSQVNFKLIDFGYAKFFSTDIGESDFVSRELYSDANHLLASPFQLRGIRIGRRDDIYRLFEVFMNCFFPNDFIFLNFYYIDNLARQNGLDRQEAVLFFKENWNIFGGKKTIYTQLTQNSLLNRYLAKVSMEPLPAFSQIMSTDTSVPDPQPPLDVIQEQRIRQIFSSMLQYVRGKTESLITRSRLDKADSEPDYDWLIKRADDIAEALSLSLINGNP